MPETRKSLIKQAAKKLKESGIPSFRLEAEILLSMLLDCDREKIFSEPDGIVPEEVIQKYHAIIDKRGERYPFQYLVHRQEFYSLDFYVDERVFIPRPESELIVDEFLKLNHKSSPRVVDVGTGSGNLAVTIATHIPGATMFAIDRSHDALDVAQFNAEKHQVSDRIRFVQGHFLECFKKSLKDLMFDFIISNPPYIRTSEMDGLQKEIKKFEPHSSLEAGEDGLTPYKEIIPASYPLLREGGSLILEIGVGMASAVIHLISEYPFEQVYAEKDPQGIDRIVLARKST